VPDVEGALTGALTSTPALLVFGAAAVLMVGPSVARGVADE